MFWLFFDGVYAPLKWGALKQGPCTCGTFQLFQLTYRACTMFIEIYRLTLNACTNIPLSSAQLLTSFQQSPLWHKVNLSKCDDTFLELAPDWMTLHWIIKINIFNFYQGGTLDLCLYDNDIQKYSRDPKTGNS